MGITQVNSPPYCPNKNCKKNSLNKGYILNTKKPTKPMQIPLQFPTHLQGACTAVTSHVTIHELSGKKMRQFLI